MITVHCQEHLRIMKTILFFGLLLALSTASSVSLHRLRRSAQNAYKMCVPEGILQDCKTMAAENTKSSAQIICIPARDRMDCLDKIQHRLADFLAVDPEDMYVGMKIPDQDFNVFQEIRTKVEPDAAYRYEAVAVVHKDLELKTMHDLKGLKSCHTGVGRNVGYKIPLTKLRKMGILGALNDNDISPRENELRALSTLFSKACIVGQWSPDPTINKKLKSRYSNLCALCEHPDICDYPDNFSGYDGALRCLAHNGGQIAWTKVIYVKKFFGLPVGVSPAVATDEDPNNFAYLCPDGSRVPITDTPCRWAARPWQGFMANADIVKNIDELRNKIANLDAIGEKKNATWFEKVLILDEKTVVKNNKPISPGDYLDKANYTDVIEREYGPPIKVLKFCVTSELAQQKCRELSKAAFSRDMRPRYECVQEANVYGCLRAIRDNAADMTALDPGLLEKEKSTYNLKPILMEEYGSDKGAFSVAVVKKNSGFTSLSDLKGKKSCHPEINNVAGYTAPLYALIKQGLIKKADCNLPKAMSEFFSGGSCLPGSKLQENNVEQSVATKLCSQCAGSTDDNKSQNENKCSNSHSEKYFGYSGAFHCLVDGQGDVAFVKHFTVKENTDGNNKNDWAKDLSSADYELLCPKGGRAPMDKYSTCNLAEIPSDMLVTSNLKTYGEIEEMRHLLTTTSNLFAKRPDIFKLFGTFNGTPDLIFRDATTRLVSYDEELQKNYNKLLKDASC